MPLLFFVPGPTPGEAGDNQQLTAFNRRGPPGEEISFYDLFGYSGCCRTNQRTARARDAGLLSIRLTTRVSCRNPVFATRLQTFLPAHSQHSLRHWFTWLPFPPLWRDPPLLIPQNLRIKAAAGRPGQRECCRRMRQHLRQCQAAPASAPRRRPCGADDKLTISAAKRHLRGCGKVIFPFPSPHQSPCPQKH